MASNKNSLVSFFREISIVVIGILIAVLLNNWKENRDNKAYISSTLTAIEREVSQCEFEVNEVLGKHLTLSDSLEASLNNPNESLVELVFNYGGIQFARTKNMGLRFFVANKAELIDYQVISHLIDIETTADVLELKMDKLLDYTYEHMEDTTQLSKTKFLTHLANVIDSERALSEMYATFKGDGSQANE